MVRSAYQLFPCQFEVPSQLSIVVRCCLVVVVDVEIVEVVVVVERLICVVSEGYPYAMILHDIPP